ncbi:MAG: SPOR domain-containing protein [Burkholderiales bacterium]|nr:SPOR domain-containing protein [Burkholderiales bacterium]
MAPADRPSEQRQPSSAAPSQPAERAALAAAPPKGKLPRGPHLQAGVFLQAGNAEELKAKLQAQGVPVYIESRVQVGPFADRKEAERMREKLKAMGVATVLIVQ